MHPNPIYRTDDEARILDFARARGFGTLAVNGDAGPLVAHVPFVIVGEGVVKLHLMRSNPIVRALSESHVPGLLAVTGADSYVSPDWYGMTDQVPTWNYAAVHLRGRLSLVPDAELRGYLDALSAEFETRLLPKKPWTLAKTSDDVVTRLMRMIVPVALEIESIDGTWKLAQNKPAAARHAAADRIEAEGIGSETSLLAEMMRGAAAGV